VKRLIAVIGAAVFCIGAPRAFAQAPAQIPAPTPMKNPPPITGTWRVAADTGLLANVELTVSQTGANHVSGVWKAANVGCAAASECQFRGAVFGYNSDARVELTLSPAVPGGVGLKIVATLTAPDSFVGRVDLRVDGQSPALGWMAFHRAPDK
jgi:hypothetical protein